MPKHAKVHSPKPMRAPKPAKASDVGDVPAEPTAQPEKSDAEIAPAPKLNVHLEATTPAIASAQELGLKVLEIAYANASAALEYADRISSVKSPSEFFRVSREDWRRQLELLSRQAAQLVTIAQKAGGARGEGSPISLITIGCKVVTEREAVSAYPTKTPAHSPSAAGDPGHRALPTTKLL